MTARGRMGLVVRWLNPVLTALVKELEAAGVTVDVIIPDAPDFAFDAIDTSHDLYAIKSGTTAGFTVATLLDRAGARLLNPFAAVATLRDKIVCTDVLRRAGVRVPETFVATSRDEILARLEGGPVVVKPHQGSRGEGVHIVRHAADLPEGRFAAPTIVQRYHAPDGEGLDHKIFRIGNELFGVARKWPIETYEDKRGTPFPVEGEIDQMIRTIGAALGISLYGADVIISDGKPYVVDVNKFGSFMGVPDAPARLCQYFVDALGRSHPEPLPLIDDSFFVRPDGLPEVVTAGGVIVRAGSDGPMIAVVRQIREGQVKYFLPKGHVEEGETIDDAARREIQEESGLTQLEKVRDLATLPACNKTKRVWKLNHFALYRTTQTHCTPPERDKELCWYPLDALPELFWPNQTALLRDHAAAIREAAR